MTDERIELLHGPGLGADRALPPIAKRALNYFRAQGRRMLAGSPTVSDAEYEARLTICDGCEMRGGGTPETPSWGKYCTHNDCGCNLLEKAGLATENCPLGKWAKG